MSNKLDELSALQMMLDAQTMNAELDRKAICSPIAEELERSAATWKEHTDATRARIDALRAEIVADTKAAGASLKGARAMAVYTPAGEAFKWNTDALMGYAATHPEILQFRTVTATEPKVVIRERK